MTAFQLEVSKIIPLALSEYGPQPWLRWGKDCHILHIWKRSFAWEHTGFPAGLASVLSGKTSPCSQDAMASCAIHTFVVAPTRFSTETMERGKGSAQFHVCEKIIMEKSVYYVAGPQCASNSLQCTSVMCSMQHQWAMYSSSVQRTVCNSSRQCAAAACRMQEQCAVCSSSSL